jgi:Tfp pilus assembly protein PilN
MIRINLLPQKKSKRRRPAAQPGEQNVAIGFGVLVVAGLALYFLVHSPKQAELEEAQGEADNLRRQNADLTKKVADVPTLQAEAQSADEQEAAIAALAESKATPAWFLQELSHILTRNGEPSMTPAMKRKVENDTSRAWQRNWDPTHVFITSLAEQKGAFTLKGQAQSDRDVVQLNKRLSASMYFDATKNLGYTKSEDKSGKTLYDFTITGKVRY